MDGISIEEISSIVGAAKGEQNFLANQFLSSLQPLFDKLDNVKNDTTKIDVTALLKLGDNDQKRFGDQYKRLMSSYLGVFGKKIKELERLNPSELLNSRSGPPRLPNLPNAINPNPRNRNSNGGAFEDGETEGVAKDTSIRISSIDDVVLKQLGNFLPQGNITITVEDSGSDSSSSSLLGKLLGGLLLGGLGVAALFQGFKSDGSLKGLLKIIGDTLIRPIIGKDGFLVQTIKGLGNLLDVDIKNAIKVSNFSSFLKRSFQIFARPFQGIAKLGGKGLKVVSKSIPFLGAFISFAFAYTRFKAGDNLGGLLEIAAGLSSLTGIGAGFSLAINLFLAGRDLTTTREERRNNIGGSLLMKIKDFFSELPVVKSFNTLFNGLYDLFTATSPQEVDAAINKIQDTDAMAIFSFFNPMVAVYNFLKVAENRDTIRRGFLAAGDFLKGIFDKVAIFFDNFTDILGDFFGNLLFNFRESNFFKGLKTRIKLISVQIQKSVITSSETIFDILKFLNRQLVKTVDNPLVKGVLKGLGLNDKAKSIEKFGNQIREFDKIKFEDLQSSLNNQESRLRMELEQFKKQQNETPPKEALRNEQRHQEMMQVSKENAAAIAAASTGTTAAVLSQNNAPVRSGGNTTNIFNQDGANNIRRTKQASFRDSLYDVP